MSSRFGPTAKSMAARLPAMSKATSQTPCNLRPPLTPIANLNHGDRSGVHEALLWKVLPHHVASSTRLSALCNSVVASRRWAPTGPCETEPPAAIVRDTHSNSYGNESSGAPLQHPTTTTSARRSRSSHGSSAAAVHPYRHLCACSTRLLYMPLVPCRD